MLEIVNHGNIRELKMARPPVNALNPTLVKLFTQSLHEAAEECSAVVISGQDGLFSAGLDVIELMQLDHAGIKDFWSAFFELLQTVACSPIPVAAAITGHSPAGGAVICILCDYRVMSSGEYQIGLNETRVGLIIPAVLHHAMERLVGARTAERMLVAGTMVDATEAHRIGLVDALESDCEATVTHAIKWCEDLLSLPQHAMNGNRAIARSCFQKEFADQNALGVDKLVDTWFSEATQTTMRSVLAQLKGK